MMRRSERRRRKKGERGGRDTQDVQLRNTPVPADRGRRERDSTGSGDHHGSGVTLPKEKEKAELTSKHGLSSGAAAVMARRQGSRSHAAAKKKPAKEGNKEKRTDGPLRYRQANYKTFETATLGKLAQPEHRKRKKRDR